MTTPSCNRLSEIQAGPLAARLLVAFVVALGCVATPLQARQTISLDGDWQFQQEGFAEWKTVPVPSSFESHEGASFDGVGWYQRQVPAFDLPPGKRVLLHFTAAATEAQVWWNGEKLGAHLGGWTPFRFDVTELVRRAPAGQAHVVRVRLDEKVGHNSQGFLPIIAPHFGGLWQGVELRIVPESYVDDLQLLAVGDVAQAGFRIEFPLAGKIPTALPSLGLRGRLRGVVDWVELPLQATLSGRQVRAFAPLKEAKLWSPAEPNLYELELTVGDDRLQTRAAFRTVEVFGQQLRLNGQPLQVRGVLNWGYSAPRTEPNPARKSGGGRLSSPARMALT